LTDYLARLNIAAAKQSWRKVSDPEIKGESRMGERAAILDKKQCIGFGTRGRKTLQD
jgi:hypothetical protein